MQSKDLNPSHLALVPVLFVTMSVSPLSGASQSRRQLGKSEASQWSQIPSLEQSW